MEWGNGGVEERKKEVEVGGLGELEKWGSGGAGGTWRGSGRVEGGGGGNGRVGDGEGAVECRSGVKWGAKEKQEGWGSERKKWGSEGGASRGMVGVWEWRWAKEKEGEEGWGSEWGGRVCGEGDGGSVGVRGKWVSPLSP